MNYGESLKYHRENAGLSQLQLAKEEYKKYPLITKQRMFYEAMEDLLPRLKVIIDDGSGNIQKYYPIESFANVGTSSTSGSSTSSSTTSSSSTTNNAEEAAK